MFRRGLRHTRQRLLSVTVRRGSRSESRRGIETTPTLPNEIGMHRVAFFVDFDIIVMLAQDLTKV